MSKDNNKDKVVRLAVDNAPKKVSYPIKVANKEINDMCQEVEDKTEQLDVIQNEVKILRLRIDAKVKAEYASVFSENKRSDKPVNLSMNVTKRQIEANAVNRGGIKLPAGMKLGGIEVRRMDGNTVDEEDVPDFVKELIAKIDDND